MAQPTSWRFHPDRDSLLAEAHARPSTPARAPILASRIATLSGEGGVEIDRAHMVGLCRKLGAPEPGPKARSGFVEAGGWSLRWERRTEVSTWTVLSPNLEPDSAPFGATALDELPQAWLSKLPGEVLAAVHATLLNEVPAVLPFLDEEVVAAELDDNAAQVFTDFRPGPDGFTRFIVVQNAGGAALAGRILHELFEMETYRLLALLAFPLAGTTGIQLSRLEAEAADVARSVVEEGGIDADRALLSRLAALAGEAEAMAATTSFRFSAATAYHGLVRERIVQLNEKPMGATPTLGEFMERRLAPAMRTCGAIAQRQRDVIERLARTTQMLRPK
jgi:uncharacterized membrane-anchored protein